MEEIKDDAKETSKEIEIAVTSAPKEVRRLQPNVGIEDDVEDERPAMTPPNSFVDKVSFEEAMAKHRARMETGLKDAALMDKEAEGSAVALKDAEPQP